MLWTVVRFPDGSWSTGGRPNDPDYAKCEVWQIEANSRRDATRKAQAKRARQRAKQVDPDDVIDGDAAEFAENGL